MVVGAQLEAALTRVQQDPLLSGLKPALRVQRYDSALVPLLLVLVVGELRRPKNEPILSHRRQQIAFLQQTALRDRQTR